MRIVKTSVLLGLTLSTACQNTDRRDDASPVKSTEAAMTARSANDLVLRPDEGMMFAIEPGVRYQGDGFSATEPDVEVFHDDLGVPYRMYFTSRDWNDDKGTGTGLWTSHSAVSRDGLSFTYEGLRLDPAQYRTNRTDRDVFRLTDGRYRMYTLIGGGDPWYCIDSYISPDGVNDFRHEPGKRIPHGDASKGGDGFPWDRTAARDPEAVHLDDGRIRLYYIGWNGPNGPYTKNPSPGDEWRILSTVSEDGLNFAKEDGVRIEGGITMSKPQLVRLTDGRWRMYFARQLEERRALVSATSTDGLAWQMEPGIRLDPGAGGFVASPSLVKTAAGDLRLYCDYSGSGLSGMCSAVCRAE